MIRRVLDVAAYVAIGTAAAGAAIVMAPGVLAFAVLQHFAEKCEAPAPKRGRWERDPTDDESSYGSWTWWEEP